MKFKYFVAMATAALVMTNCSKEESLVNEESAGLNQIIATVEGKEARSTTNDAGVFKWSEGDQLKVIDNSNGKSYYQYGDNGKFSLISGQGIIGSSMYAAYPANEETSDFDVKFDITDEQNGVRSIEYPSVLGSSSEEYKENTNAMMLAKVDPTNLSVLNFKHLGGVMRFTIQDVPIGCKYFEFTATDKRINGKFKLSSLAKENNEGDLKTTTDGVYYVETVSVSEGNTSIRNFKATTSVQTMTFYVPLPVGEYSNFEIKLGFNGDQTSITKSYSGSTKKINRRTLMMMSTLKVENNSLVSATTDNSTEVTLLEEDQQLSVNGSGETITVNVPDGTDATAKLNLNFTPTDENSTLAISDGSGDSAASTESEATVNVNADNATVGELTINAPTLTVNLASGTFTSVTAKTANNTLVIKAGVNVETLKLNGGNVIIEEGATVGSIVNAEAYSANTYILKKGTLTDTPDLTNIVFVSSESEMNLRTVAENGGNVTLTEDVTLTEALTIAQGKKVKLDLGGNTLTVLNSDFINEGDISITNGTVTGDNTQVGRRAIINKAKMVLENVTVLQVYEQGGSAVINDGSSADLSIEEGTNITASNMAISNKNGAELTIDGGEIIGYGKGLSYTVVNQLGSTLIINGGTIKGIHGAVATSEGSDVDINGGTIIATKQIGEVTGTSHYCLWIYNPTPEDVIEVTLDDCTLDASNSTYSTAVYKGYNKVTESTYITYTVGDNVTINATTPIKENESYEGD